MTTKALKTMTTTDQLNGCEFTIVFLLISSSDVTGTGPMMIWVIDPSHGLITADSMKNLMPRFGINSLDDLVVQDITLRV